MYVCVCFKRTERTDRDFSVPREYAIKCTNLRTERSFIIMFVRAETSRLYLLISLFPATVGQIKLRSCRMEANNCDAMS